MWELFHNMCSLVKTVGAERWGLVWWAVYQLLLVQWLGHQAPLRHITLQETETQSLSTSSEQKTQSLATPVNWEWSKYWDQFQMTQLHTQPAPPLIPPPPPLQEREKEREGEKEWVGGGGEGWRRKDRERETDRDRESQRQREKQDRERQRQRQREKQRQRETEREKAFWKTCD